MTMFTLPDGAPLLRCDVAGSKAWGITRQDSLSFLDHGIGPVATANAIPGRPTIPDLQTALSWGSLASQTLAMYPKVRPMAQSGSTVRSWEFCLARPLPCTQRYTPWLAPIVLSPQ